MFSGNSRAKSEQRPDQTVDKASPNRDSIAFCEDAIDGGTKLTAKEKQGFLAQELCLFGVLWDEVDEMVLAEDK